MAYTLIAVAPFTRLVHILVAPNPYFWRKNKSCAGIAPRRILVSRWLHLSKEARYNCVRPCAAPPPQRPCLVSCFSARSRVGTIAVGVAIGFAVSGAIGIAAPKPDSTQTTKHKLGPSRYRAIGVCAWKAGIGSKVIQGRTRTPFLIRFCVSRSGRRVSVSTGSWRLLRTRFSSRESRRRGAARATRARRHILCREREWPQQRQRIRKTGLHPIQSAWARQIEAGTLRIFRWR